MRVRHLVIILIVISGCQQRELDRPLPWYGDNLQQLNNLIGEYGRTSRRYDASHQPLAIFDWDNTVIKNDAGDATVFWMLQQDRILQPPNRDWRRTSQYLTVAASQALESACGPLAEPGARLPTSSHPNCAGEIVTIYREGRTTAGATAMSGWNHRRTEPRYAWAAQLHAGYSPDEVRDFSRRAMAENLANPIGATQRVGTVPGLPAYLRVYEQIRDLIAKLQDAGFAVWIVSASPQFIIEPYATLVGIPPNRVIGIRSVIRDGRLSYGLEGCGNAQAADVGGEGAAAGDSTIPFMDGKRCWINRIIFADRSDRAWQLSADPARRPVFAAGDSDGDVTLLRDATGLRLAINRNRSELQCYAYWNEDRRWIVNPMFIEPLSRRSEPYRCSTSSCTTESGQSVPCLDKSEKVIPDQEDRVF